MARFWRTSINTDYYRRKYKKLSGFEARYLLRLSPIRHEAKDAGTLRLLVESYPHFLALMESATPPKHPSNFFADLVVGPMTPWSSCQGDGVIALAR